jgi:hypothetical protein
MHRGKGISGQTLTLTSIQFIDTENNTVIKELDATMLARPQGISIALGVSAQKPPLYPRQPSPKKPVTEPTPSLETLPTPPPPEEFH